MFLNTGTGCRVVKYEACGTRPHKLFWTTTLTFLGVPDPALIPAQGVLLLIPALTPALHIVEGVVLTGTLLLLLQAVTAALSVLLYLHHGTGLVTHTRYHTTGGQHDRHLQGGGHHRDTAVGGRVASTSTLSNRHMLRGHL